MMKRAIAGQYQPDIDYLRAEPYTTTEEQAMRERMRARIRNEFDTARQRTVDTLGEQQGMSGPLSNRLRELDEAEARAYSDIDRDLMLQAAQERRSRLGEARGVQQEALGLQGTLAQMQRGLELMGLDRQAQSREMFSYLEALERQRQMEAMGVEQSLDEAERARIMDVMAMLGLAPNPSTIAGISGNLLSYAQGLGQQAAQQQAGQNAGFSNLAQLYYLLRPTTTGTVAAPPSPPPY